MKISRCNSITLCSSACAENVKQRQLASSVQPEKTNPIQQPSFGGPYCGRHRASKIRRHALNLFLKGVLSGGALLAALSYTNSILFP